MTEELNYDSVEVGQELPPFTYELTPDRVAWYLEEAGEANPIYRDPERARRAGLEGPVCPPLISLMYAAPPGLLAGLGRVLPGHSIHARSEYTFIKPARPEDVITSRARVEEKFIRKGRKYVTLFITSVNQKGETLLLNRHTSVWPR